MIMSGEVAVPMTPEQDLANLRANPDIQEFASIPDNPEYWALVKETQPLMAKLVRACCKIMDKEVN